MKKVNRLLLFSIVLLLTISIVISVFFAVLLPVYLERVFLPNLAKKSGIDEFSCKVRKIGTKSADFAEINIGAPHKTALSIDSVRVDYSLSGLFNKHLKNVQVCGLKLYFEVENKKVGFPGIDFEKLISGSAKIEDNKSDAGFLPPITFDRIDIENAVLNGVLNRQVFKLPLDVSIFPLNDSYEILKSSIDLYPFESKIKTEVLLNLKSGNLKVNLNGENLKPENYLQYLEGAQNLQLYGSINVTAAAEIDTEAFEMSNAEIFLESRKFFVAPNDIIIGGSKINSEPISIEIRGEDFKNWKITASGLAFVSPPYLEVPEIRAALQIGQDFVESHFELYTIMECTDNCDIKITPSFQSLWTGSGRYFHDTDWTFEVENTSAEISKGKKAPLWYRIQFADIDAGISMPHINIAGQGNLENGSGGINANVSGIHLDSGAVSVEVPEAILTAETISSGRKENEYQGIDFNMRFINPGIRSTTTDVGFKNISLSGRYGLRGPENDFKITFGMADGYITDTLYGLRADGIHLDFPFVRPFDRKAGSGSFVINNIKIDQKQLGKIWANLHQENSGVALKGAYESRLFPGLSLKFEGNTTYSPKGSETKFYYSIEDYQIREYLNLGSIFPEGEGVFLTGLFNMDGNFYQSDTKMTSSINLNGQGMNISVQEPLMTISNLHVDFKMPDLFQMRSLPHQTIKFDSAKAGNIMIGDGSIDFQMQAPDLFFIEKTTFRWCGGNVDTNAAVVSLPFKEIGLTFYCDRLKLAQVLEQLGGVKGDGEGAVNGRIPVRYEEGNLRFDKGFLYSTPGEGGTIRLTGTDFLMSGIPEGTPQFSQIDLAREALKNYRYDWAKVDITTEEKNLNLKLKLDGKPLDVLPFEYRHDFGGFARVETGSPGSRFQGIRLDVNFNLPLDQVLKYGKGFQDIFKLSD
ncbi:MAG: YdbH domain-containing protein [Desulfobacterales bacterium]